MKHPFSYEVIYSGRKTLAIQITTEGSVKVRAPKNCPRSSIDRFLKEKEAWVLKYVEKAKQTPQPAPQPLTTRQRSRYIKIARDIFTQKTAYYASIMHVFYGRISIREQKTRWGSCSSQGNLNYNWRLIFAPEDVLDYIVVHELAHRKEMNHSAAFYNIVEEILPNYKSCQKWLRDNGAMLWSKGV